jgi:hypothetical protein
MRVNVSGELQISTIVRVSVALCGLLVLAALSGSVSMARAAAPQPLSWSGPILVSGDHPGAPTALNVYSPNSSSDPGYNGAPISVPACGRGICLIGDGTELYATPNPTGQDWSVISPEGDTPGAGAKPPSHFSCVSERFCATAFTLDGEIMFTATTTPLTAGAWPQAITIAPPGSPATTPEPPITTTPSAIACPSTSLCLVLSRAGTLYWSTAPTASGSWRSTQLLKTAGGSMKLTCASTKLCFASNGKTKTLVTSNPAGGVWTAANAKLATAVAHGANLPACAGARLCVFASQGGVFYASTKPASATSWKQQWKDPDNGTNGIVGATVACPGTHLCIAVDGARNLIRSTKPTGGRTAWHAHNDTGAILEPGGIWCWGLTSCLMYGDPGNGDNIVANRNIRATKSGWIGVASAGIPADFNRIVCAAATLCLAIDGNGRLQVSTTPTADTSWTTIPLPQKLADLACSSPSLCFARGTQGQLLTSISPVTAGTWSTERSKVDAITCIQQGCYALTTKGRVESLSGPSLKIALPHWAAPTAGAALTCTEPGRCLAVAGYEHGGTVWAVNGSHATRNVTTNKEIANPTVGCMTANECTVRTVNSGHPLPESEPAGGALTSTNAFASKPHWSYSPKAAAGTIRCFGSAGCSLLLLGAYSLTDHDDPEALSVIWRWQNGSGWKYTLWSALPSDVPPASISFNDVAEAGGDWFVAASGGTLITGVPGSGCNINAADAGCAVPNPGD